MVTEGLCGKHHCLRLFDLDRFDHWSVTRDLVEDRLHRHGALGQLGKVTALEMLSDPVVKCPEGTALELVVARVAELLHRLVNVTGGKRLGIYKINNHVGATVRLHLGVLVSVDALAHVCPVGDNARDRVRQDHWKVAQDVRRVTTSKLHIRREAKVFADQHLIADADGSREGLIVCVTKPDHQTAIFSFHIFALDGKASEVTKTTTTKRVFLLLNRQSQPDQVPDVCLLNQQWRVSIGVCVSVALRSVATVQRVARCLLCFLLVLGSCN